MPNRDAESFYYITMVTRLLKLKVEFTNGSLLDILIV